MSRRSKHLDIMKNHFLFIISEIHSQKLHITQKFFIGSRSILLMIMLPCPDSGTLLCFCQGSVCFLSGIDQSYITLIRFRLFIQKVKDTLRPCQSHGDKVYLLADLINRHIKAFIEGQEAGKSSEGKASDSMDSKNTTGDRHQNITDITNLRINRHHYIGVFIRIVCTDEKLLIEFIKPFDIFFFPIKYLYNLLSLHHFLNKSIGCAKVSLLRQEIPAGIGCQFFGEKEHHSNHQQSNSRQRNTEPNHTDYHTDKSDSTVKNLRNTLGNHLTQSVNIVGINRHDVPVGMGIKIFNRKILHMVKNIFSEIFQRSLCNKHHNLTLCQSRKDSDSIKACHSSNCRSKRAKVMTSVFQHRNNIDINQGLHKHGSLHIGKHADKNTDDDDSVGNAVVFHYISKNPLHQPPRLFNLGFWSHRTPAAMTGHRFSSCHYASPPFSSKSPPPLVCDS